MTTRTLQHTHVEYQNGMKTGNHVVRTHANTHIHLHTYTSRVIHRHMHSLHTALVYLARTCHCESMVNL